MDELVPKARCVHCRSDVSVPAQYANGDHIKCPTCNTQHKVQRGDSLRLVLADIGPLKEALYDNGILVERLEAEIKDARASFGVGANGFGISVIYVLYQVAFRDQPWSWDLLKEAGGVLLGSGLALELANYLFLAKRQKLTRLSRELEEAREDGRQLHQKFRDATRRS
jgi:hypothetical protein